MSYLIWTANFIQILKHFLYQYRLCCFLFLLFDCLIDFVIYFINLCHCNFNLTFKSKLKILLLLYLHSLYLNLFTNLNQIGINLTTKEISALHYFLKQACWSLLKHQQLAMISSHQALSTKYTLFWLSLCANFTTALCLKNYKLYRKHSLKKMNSKTNFDLLCQL